MSLQKRTDLREQAMGDELMVFDEQADKVHVLNITSAFLWRSLDRTADVDTLAALLRERFQPEASADTRGMAERALAQFRKLNLLQPPAAG